MSIRVSGLVSGLDTDSIVQELVSAYSKKKDKHVKAQTKLEWKMDAWKDLNKKVNSLYKKLGNMKLSTYYNKKTTSISDSTKATVTASNTAMNGTQRLKINKVATTGYLTGAQLDKGITSSTTLGEWLGDDAKGSIAITTKNGTQNIEVNSKMKVSEFVNKLKSAGVSANFDSTYNRMYITAKDSGEVNDFGLTASDANGLKVLQGLGIYVDSKGNQDAYSKWDKYAVDVDGNPTTDPAKIQANFEKILNTIDMYNGDADVAGSIKSVQKENADLKTAMTGLQAERSYANAYKAMKEALAAKEDDGTTEKLTEPEQASLEALLRKKDEDLTDPDKAQLDYYKEKLGFSDKDFAKLKANAKSVEKFETDPDSNPDTITDVQGDVESWLTTNEGQIKTLNEQMEANNKLIAEKQAYIKDNQHLTASAPAATLTKEELEKMTATEIADFKAKDIKDRAKVLIDKYNYVQDIKNNPGDFSAGAVRIAGTDAEIELNDVTYTSASNNITVNGITITALQTTAKGATPDQDEVLTISTQTDAQGIYNSVKDFLKEYNALIKEMDELFNAASAKGYEPLTDEEKEAMGEKEIEKWEEKIKKSLLRRDDNLSTVMNLMTNSMAKSFTLSDGKKYSLASFGIKTQGYMAAGENEGYLYHIDGDAEDEVSSGNADRLLAAIQKDPEMVQEFFQKLSDDLYTKLDKKMKSSSMNSKYSIYNDKKMQKDYDEYTKTIKKWEEKVTTMEDYYYKKFTAMEKALSTLQQSTSALGGLLGS